MRWIASLLRHVGLMLLLAGVTMLTLHAYALTAARYEPMIELLGYRLSLGWTAILAGAVLVMIAFLAGDADRRPRQPLPLTQRRRKSAYFDE